MSNIILTPDFFGLFLGIGVLFVIVVFTVSTFSKSKTEIYRRLMNDLYVVGRIRQLATENGIDLDQELKDFHKGIKEIKRYEQSLDDSIEDDLKETLAEDNIKKKADK